VARKVACATQGERDENVVSFHRYRGRNPGACRGSERQRTDHELGRVHYVVSIHRGQYDGAGRSYTIRPDDDDPNILVLNGSRADVLFQTENKVQQNIPSNTEVMFSRYGSGYVLKNIQVEGSEIGYITVPVEGERHVRKLGASSGEQRVAAKKKADTSK
jgi:hypothetical protein